MHSSCTFNFAACLSMLTHHAHIRQRKAPCRAGESELELCPVLATQV